MGKAGNREKGSKSERGRLPRFRVWLTVSGFGCASEAASLERALNKIEGIQDVTANPLRDKLAVEVDSLARIEAVLSVLERRRYSVDTDVRVTTWLGGGPERLTTVRNQLLEYAGVTYCRVARPTGRFEFGIALGTGRESTLREICTWLCEEASAAVASGDRNEE